MIPIKSADPFMDLDEEQIERYVDWKRQLRTDHDIMGGAVTFANSRLTVRHIGSMIARGATPEEVIEDYPYLTPQDLEFARLFVQAQLATDQET